MHLSRIERRRRDLEVDPLPQLCAATESLRRMAGDAGAPVGRVQRETIDRLIAVTVWAEQTLAVQRARIRYLEGLSITDELTGLLNRRGFHFELTRALARAERTLETGLLVLCDLDGFKAVNDRHGHLAGDAVLCAVAGLLAAKTRRTDYVARLGGDEFAVLMAHSTRAQAERRVSVLASLINGLVVDWDGHRLPVSASIGFEGYHRGSRPDSLFFLADRSLYRRKRPRLVSDRSGVS